MKFSCIKERLKVSHTTKDALVFTQRNSMLTHWPYYSHKVFALQKSNRSVIFKKSIPNKFEKFLRKHLYWGSFLKRFWEDFGAEIFSIFLCYSSQRMVNRLDQKKLTSFSLKNIAGNVTNTYHSKIYLFKSSFKFSDGQGLFSIYCN